MSRLEAFIAEYTHQAYFYGTGLMGFILLRLVRGKSLSFVERLFASWQLVAFSMHLVIDTYYLYTPRVLPHSPNELPPAADDFRRQFVESVRSMWVYYGHADGRVFADEFQPVVQTLAFGAAIGGGSLTLLTYLGHLIGAKWSHPIQIVAATWHIGIHYGFLMPEYLSGFQHIKDMYFFGTVNLPFLVMPTLSLLVSLCKLSCSGNCRHSGSNDKKIQ